MFILSSRDDSFGRLETQRLCHEERFPAFLFKQKLYRRGKTTTFEKLNEVKTIMGQVDRLKLVNLYWLPRHKLL